MKALLIDDERLARAELTELLSKFKDLEIVGEAKNGEEALVMISELTPDVLFLDVEMPGINGFELLKQIEVTPYIIFISAHEKHAIEAFDVNAIDYLLKPVDPVRLEESIEKLIKTIEDEDFRASSNYSRKGKTLTLEDRILLKENEHYFFPKIKEIHYIENEGNYSRVYFNNKNASVLKSLNYLESRLDPKFFFRANRKTIVNTEYLDTIANWFNGKILMKMIQGKEIEVSRRQAVRFREEMMF